MSDQVDHLLIRIVSIAWYLLELKPNKSAKKAGRGGSTVKDFMGRLPEKRKKMFSNFLDNRTENKVGIQPEY